MAPSGADSSVLLTLTSSGSTMNPAAVVPMTQALRGWESVSHGSVVVTNFGLDTTSTHVLAHLVGRLLVTALVLAVLALCTLLTIVGAAVATAPSGLDVAVLDLGTPLGFLFRAHVASSVCGEWERTPHLDLAHTLSSMRYSVPVIP